MAVEQLVICVEHNERMFLWWSKYESESCHKEWYINIMKSFILK